MINIGAGHVIAAVVHVVVVLIMVMLISLCVGSGVASIGEDVVVMMVDGIVWDRVVVVVGLIVAVSVRCRISCWHKFRTWDSNWLNVKPSFHTERDCVLENQRMSQ